MRYELTTATNSAAITLPVAQIETTVWQADGQQSMPGLPGVANIEHGGYLLAKAAGNMEAEIRARMEAANTAICSVLVGTNLSVIPVYTLQGGYSSILTIDLPSDKVVALKANWQGGNGKTRRGYVAAYGSYVATGVQAAVDFGAAGAAGGQAILHVTAAVGGITNGVIVLEGATDAIFTTPVTLATFDVDAVGAQVAALPTTVQRYQRLNVSDLGGATSISLALISAVAGVTY